MIFEFVYQMDNERNKYVGLALVILEIILASSLVLLSFTYAVWPKSFDIATVDFRVLIREGIKRQVLISIIGLALAWGIHSLNGHWIRKTRLGSLRNSFIFSSGLFLLIFLAGLSGTLIFIFQ